MKNNNGTFDAKTELDNHIQNGLGNARVSKGRGTNYAGDISKRNERSKSTYNSTKVKARSFLSNISNKRLKKNDHENQSFVVDDFTFIILNLNPLSLARKLHIRNYKTMQTCCEIFKYRKNYINLFVWKKMY